MAKPARPGAVTAMAILNYVFGGLGIVTFLCGGALVIFFVSILSNAAPAPGQPDPTEPFKLLDKAEPNLKYIYGVTMTISFFMAILLVIAGAGLWKMRYWGRKLSIFYGAVGIVMALVGLGINIAVANPAMERWQKDLEKWVQENAKKTAPKGAAAPAPAPPPMFGGGNPAFNAVGSVFGTAIGLAYPCILLYIMMLPRIRRAFAVANGDAAPESDEPEDDLDRREDNYEQERGYEDERYDRPEDRPDDPRFRA